jgi:hypothetical protein
VAREAYLAGEIFRRSLPVKNKKSKCKMQNCGAASRDDMTELKDAPKACCAQQQILMFAGK